MMLRYGMQDVVVGSAAARRAPFEGRRTIAHWQLAVKDDSILLGFLWVDLSVWSFPGEGCGTGVSDRLTRDEAAW